MLDTLILKMFGNNTGFEELDQVVETPLDAFGGCLPSQFESRKIPAWRAQPAQMGLQQSSWIARRVEHFEGARVFFALFRSN
jgi:hypothetical protein